MTVIGTGEAPDTVGGSHTRPSLWRACYGDLSTSSHKRQMERLRGQELVSHHLT